MNSNKNAFQKDAYRPLFTVLGVLPVQRLPPGQRPPCGQTNVSGNITLPQTLFAGSNNLIFPRCKDFLYPFCNFRRYTLRLVKVMY